MKDGLLGMRKSNSRYRRRRGSILPEQRIVEKYVRELAWKLQTDKGNQRKVLLASLCIWLLIFFIVPPDIQESTEEEYAPVASISYTTTDLEDAHGISPSNKNDVARQIQRRSQRQFLERTGEKSTDETVTIIAACKDRAAALEASLPSWRNVKGLTEIVLVDYGSEKTSEMSSLVKGLPENPNVAEVYIQMTSKESQWSISRAYNLAASVASGRTIVKADCDTILSPDFLKYHPIDMHHRHKFYTADWTSLHSNPLAGVFVMDRMMFELAGGFDERFVSYGGENADLYNRLLHSHGMYDSSLNKTTCHHLSEDNVASNTHLHSVTSPRENMMAVSMLPVRWNLASSRRYKSMFYLDEKTPRSKGISSIWAASKPQPTTLLTATPLRWSIDAFAQLGDEELNEVQTHAVQEALHLDFGVPQNIIEQMPIYDCTTLLSEMHRTGSRAIFAHLAGSSLPDRFNNLARAIALGASLTRPVVIFWSPLGDIARDQDYVLTVEDIFDIQKTNSALFKSGLLTQVLVGKTWPGRSSESGKLPQRGMSLYTKGTLYSSPDEQLQLANPPPNSHIFIELLDAKTLAEAKPIAFAYTGDETDALYHRQGSDKYYTRALEDIALPAHIDNQRRASSKYIADRPGAMISDRNDLYEFNSMMQKQKPDSHNTPKSSFIISSGLPDELDAAQARVRWGAHNVQVQACESATDLDTDATCAQVRFADMLELSRAKTLWPDVTHPDARDTPGLKALVSMRNALNTWHMVP